MYLPLLRDCVTAAFAQARSVCHVQIARASLCIFIAKGVASAAGTRGRVALLAACGDRRGNMQGSKPAPPLPYRAGPAARPAGLRQRHMRCRLRPYRRPAPPGRQRCPVPRQRSQLLPRAAAAAAPVAAPVAGRPCDEARQGAWPLAYTMSHVQRVFTSTPTALHGWQTHHAQ